jgi:hypothetical protein
MNHGEHWLYIARVSNSIRVRQQSRVVDLQRALITTVIVGGCGFINGPRSQSSSTVRLAFVLFTHSEIVMYCASLFHCSPVGCEHGCRTHVLRDCTIECIYAIISKCISMPVIFSLTYLFERCLSRVFWVIPPRISKTWSCYYIHE